MGFFNKKSDLYNEYIVATNEMRGAFKFMHTFDEGIAKQVSMSRGAATFRKMTLVKLS